MARTLQVALGRPCLPVDPLVFPRGLRLLQSQRISANDLSQRISTKRSQRKDLSLKDPRARQAISAKGSKILSQGDSAKASQPRGLRQGNLRQGISAKGFQPRDFRQGDVRQGDLVQGISAMRSQPRDLSEVISAKGSQPRDLSQRISAK